MPARLPAFAQARGKLKKGGAVDVAAAARIVLQASRGSLRRMADACPCSAAGPPTLHPASKLLQLLPAFVAPCSPLPCPSPACAAPLPLQDWNDGRIPYFTVPPQRDSEVAGSARVVAAWGSEFDVDQSAALAGLRGMEEGGGGGGAFFQTDTLGTACIDLEGLKLAEEEEGGSGSEDDDDDDDEEEEEDGAGGLCRMHTCCGELCGASVCSCAAWSCNSKQTRVLMTHVRLLLPPVPEQKA